jgi:hypothetical protein
MQAIPRPIERHQQTVCRSLQALTQCQTLWTAGRACKCDGSVVCSSRTAHTGIGWASAALASDPAHGLIVHGTQSFHPTLHPPFVPAAAVWTARESRQHCTPEIPRCRSPTSPSARLETVNFAMVCIQLRSRCRCYQRVPGHHSNSAQAHPLPLTAFPQFLATEVASGHCTHQLKSLQCYAVAGVATILVLGPPTQASEWEASLRPEFRRPWIDHRLQSHPHSMLEDQT